MRVSVQLLLAVLLVMVAHMLYSRYSHGTKHKILDGSNTYHSFPLIKKTKVSKNTAVYRFQLPNSSDVLGLPIGQHITVRANIDGKNIMRSYTPISLDTDTPGYFELIVKSYDKGNVSKYVNEMSIGDCIDVMGPKGFYNYEPNMFDEIHMIAGGSGIAPMYQLIKAIHGNDKDHTRINLLFGNASIDDILLKDELEIFASNKPNQFKITYLLDKLPDNYSNTNWDVEIGYVTLDMMKKYFPLAEDDIKNGKKSQIVVCGPPPMVSTIKRSIVAMGYPRPKTLSKMDDKVFLF